MTQAAEQTPNLQALQRVERKVTLTADEIKTLWTDKILNDTAYIALALKINEHRYQQLQTFDINSFIREWEASEEDLNGNPKVKTLKVKAVRDAIEKMTAASLLKTQQQLSLEINW